MITQENAALLKILFKAKPKARQAILQNADPSLIRSICECCYNVLQGNVPLNNIEKNKLKKYKTTLRYLAGKQGSLKQRKKHIQKGGFLTALLAPIIGGLLSSIIK
jgi:hypothetical protein